MHEDTTVGSYDQADQHFVSDQHVLLSTTHVGRKPTIIWRYFILNIQWPDERVTVVPVVLAASQKSYFPC